MSIFYNKRAYRLSFSARPLKMMGSVFLCVLILRGPLFRTFGAYKAVKRYPLEYKITDEKLQNFIAKHPDHYDRYIKDINHISLIAQKITADALSFSKDSVYANPNQSFTTEIANDAGYSAFYNTICNYLIDMYGLKGQYHCYHLIGACHFMNKDLTVVRSIRGRNIFPSEFHFNIIIETKTRENLAVDPSLYDAYRISNISLLTK